jgi:hypothetical protein
MEHNFASAREFDKWVNANAAQRQSAQPDVSVGIAEKAQQRDKSTERLSGKEQLAANLQAAKEAGPQKEPDRDVSAPEAANQEKLSGKERLAANLKAAKESSNETEQNPSRDTGRSR